MGAVLVSTPIVYASASRGHPIYGFAVREQQKAHGLKRSIEESYHPDGQALLCPGRRVAIVDDVVTKGGSVFKAIDAVRERKCEIVTVMALVDRKAGGGDRLVAKGLPYFYLFWTDDEGNLHINDDIGQVSVPSAATAEGHLRPEPVAVK